MTHSFLPLLTSPPPGFQRTYCRTCGIIPSYSFPLIPPCGESPAAYYRQITRTEPPANEP